MKLITFSMDKEKSELSGTEFLLQHYISDENVINMDAL